MLNRTVNNSSVAAAKNLTNSSESIRINDEKEKSFRCFPPTSKSKSSTKYLSDEKLKENVKTTLSNYIGENCTVEQVQIRIRDNEKRGYVARVKIKGDQEIKVSEFLNGSFCKDKKISRFTLISDDGKNSVSCDVDGMEFGTTKYKMVHL